MLHHLRQNVVAYLALAVALGTGTAYAADQIANGSVTSKKLAKNSVTSPKIKKNAVKSADVKDGSLGAADLAPGTLVQANFASTVVVGALDPVAAPDVPAADAHAFTVPRAGTVVIEYAAEVFNGSCSGASARAGLYLDGAPLSGTGVPVPPPSDPPESVILKATAAVAGGAHTVAVGLDCPTGPVGAFRSGRSFMVLLLAE
ncbi:hypothetical protein [Nocardioides dilutus]